MARRRHASRRPAPPVVITTTTSNPTTADAPWCRRPPRRSDTRAPRRPRALEAPPPCITALRPRRRCISPPRGRLPPRAAAGQTLAARSPVHAAAMEVAATSSAFRWSPSTPPLRHLLAQPRSPTPLVSSLAVHYCRRLCVVAVANCCLLLPLENSAIVAVECC